MLKIHPLLSHKIDTKEQMLMDFRESVRSYKAKSSCLEIGILKTKDDKVIGMFKDAIQEQNHSKIIKAEREKMQ